jgi:hypothetical protein
MPALRFARPLAAATLLVAVLAACGPGSGASSNPGQTTPQPLETMVTTETNTDMTETTDMTDTTTTQ